MPVIPSITITLHPNDLLDPSVAKQIKHFKLDISYNNFDYYGKMQFSYTIISFLALAISSTTALPQGGPIQPIFSCTPSTIGTTTAGCCATIDSNGDGSGCMLSLYTPVSWHCLGVY